MPTAWNRFIYIFSKKFVLFLPIYFGLLFFLSLPVLAATKALKPDIEFSLPKTVTADEKFDIEFEVKNIPAGGDLHLKFIAYKTSSDGKKSYYSCTYAEDTCLGNSDKWDSFPKFDRNSKEEIDGTITTSVKNEEEARNFTVLLRLGRTTISKTGNVYTTTYDSNSHDLWVNPSPLEPEPIEETEGIDETKNVPPPTHYPVLETNIEYKLPATFSAVPAVLGQASTSSSPSANATASATPSATSNQQTRNFIFLILAAVVVVFTAVAGTLWYYKTNGSNRN